MPNARTMDDPCATCGHRYGDHTPGGCAGPYCDAPDGCTGWTPVPTGYPGGDGGRMALHDMEVKAWQRWKDSGAFNDITHGVPLAPVYVEYRDLGDEDDYAHPC